MTTCALARCAAPRAPRLGVSTLPARSRHLPLAPPTRRHPVATTAAASDGGGTTDDPWNKGPIDLDNRLYAYLLEHTREPEILRKLRVETATLRGSQMQVPPEQGALLRLIVELTGARRIIEVGTYTGYSSIAMALALPPAPDGLLVACDSSAPSLEVARRYWDEAGVSTSSTNAWATRRRRSTTSSPRATANERTTSASWTPINADTGNITRNYCDWFDPGAHRHR